MQNLTITEL